MLSKNIRRVCPSTREGNIFSQVCPSVHGGWSTPDHKLLTPTYTSAILKFYNEDGGGGSTHWSVLPRNINGRLSSCHRIVLVQHVQICFLICMVGAIYFDYTNIGSMLVCFCLFLFLFLSNIGCMLVI